MYSFKLCIIHSFYVYDQNRLFTLNAQLHVAEQLMLFLVMMQFSNAIKLAQAHPSMFYICLVIYSVKPQSLSATHVGMQACRFLVVKVGLSYNKVSHVWPKSKNLYCL